MMLAGDPGSHGVNPVVIAVIGSAFLLFPLIAAAILKVMKRRRRKGHTRRARYRITED